MIGACASGCSIGGVLTHRAPSASARLIQKWSFADFARDVEEGAADLRLSNNSPPPGSPVVLVPVPEVGSDAFADMKELSRSDDEVSEFVDTMDGRYFFCLTRAGRIVKTYEFENRARASGIHGGRPMSRQAGVRPALGAGPADGV